MFAVLDWLIPIVRKSALLRGGFWHLKQDTPQMELVMILSYAWSIIAAGQLYPAVSKEQGGPLNVLLFSGSEDEALPSYQAPPGLAFDADGKTGGQQPRVMVQKSVAKSSSSVKPPSSQKSPNVEGFSPRNAPPRDAKSANVKVSRLSRSKVSSSSTATSSSSEEHKLSEGRRGRDSRMTKWTPRSRSRSESSGESEVRGDGRDAVLGPGLLTATQRH